MQGGSGRSTRAIAVVATVTPVAAVGVPIPDGTAPSPATARAPAAASAPTATTTAAAVAAATACGVAILSRRAPHDSALQSVQSCPHARHSSVVYAVLYPPQRRRPVVRRHFGLRRGRRQVGDQQLPPRGRHHQRLPHCPVGGGGRGGKSHRFDHRRRVGRGSGALQQRRDGAFRARQRSRRRGRPSPAPTPRSARWRRGAANRAAQLAPAPLTPAPLRPAVTTAAASEAVGAPPTPWLAVEKSVGPHGRQHPHRGAPVANGERRGPHSASRRRRWRRRATAAGRPQFPPPSPRCRRRRRGRGRLGGGSHRRCGRRRPLPSSGALHGNARVLQQLSRPLHRRKGTFHRLKSRQCGVRPAVEMSRPRFIRCPG